ncbi:hypothetical protein WN943_010844 [Citrus x changshan-huyou]
MKKCGLFAASVAAASATAISDSSTTNLACNSNFQASHEVNLQIPSWVSLFLDFQISPFGNWVSFVSVRLIEFLLIVCTENSLRELVFRSRFNLFSVFDSFSLCFFVRQLLLESTFGSSA